MNEARAKAGQPPLPFLTPKLYPMLGRSGGLRDITSGSNGDFSAGSGYDMVTGIGVPDVRELLTALGTPVAARRAAAVPTTTPVK